MKNNIKSKKVAAKKPAPAAKVTAKSASKSVAKTSKTTKPTVKAAAKKVVKATKSAAAPAKKVSKPAAVVKKTVAKAPVKSVKPAEKPAKAAKQTIKAPQYPAKKAPVAKATTKAAAPAAKIMSTRPVSKNAVNTMGVRPILVKMPQNQNAPVKSPMIAMARPQPTAAQKSGTAQTSGEMARPVYRPIQVINKSLAPLQPVRQMAPILKSDEKVEFVKGDYVVYPAHGVGEIEAVETQTIGGMEIKLYAIVFEKDRMRLKVPVFKAHASGLRRLSSTGRMQDALKTLQGRAQIRRAMWSRRAQEYETKINSGDPVSIAEVLRDLKRSNDDNEQSYSERQIYQSALERLAREVAALDKISETEAAERLENMIKGRRSRAATAKAKEEAVA